MNFIDQEHKDFYENTVNRIERFRTTDVYYRSLIYTLGISPVTRQHFNEIFNVSKMEINVESLRKSWQTGTSIMVTELAFNLFNDFRYRSYEDMEKKRMSADYTVSNMFCCSYAPFFYEAIKVRYPEYTRTKEEQKEILQQFENSSSEKAEDESIVALYIRTNQIGNEDVAKMMLYSQKDKLESYCKSHNISNRKYYIDEQISELSDEGIALHKLIEDIKLKKIEQVVVQDITRISRNYEKVSEFLAEIAKRKTQLVCLENPTEDFFPTKSWISNYYESKIDNANEGEIENM